jgi:hypothetical protein
MYGTDHWARTFCSDEVPKSGISGASRGGISEEN